MGIGVLDLRLEAEDWVLGSVVWGLGLGVWSFRVWGFGVWGLGIWGIGLKFWSLGFEGWGPGFGV